MRRDDDRDFPDPAKGELRSPSPREVEAAARWLRKLLASGPMYQFEIQRRAEDAGIRGSLLRQARKEAGVISENYNEQNELATWKCWFWSLPPKPKKRGLFDDRGRDDDRDPPWDD
jgi:hypothetical protein